MYTPHSKLHLKLLFRKVFGQNNRNDLTSTAKANMSVNALARQRAQRDDADFDSS
jgi:hypothetical protein